LIDASNKVQLNRYENKGHNHKHFIIESRCIHDSTLQVFLFTQGLKPKITERHLPGHQMSCT